MKKNFQKTLAASHVAQQTYIKRYSHNILSRSSKTGIEIGIKSAVRYNHVSLHLTPPPRGSVNSLLTHGAGVETLMSMA